jgi:protein YibB
MLEKSFKNIRFDLFWPKKIEKIHYDIEPEDISIVTAFFDIGRENWGVNNKINMRHKRNVDDYLSYFSNLSKIKNQLIIFIDENLAKQVLDMRLNNNLGDQTIILTKKDFFKEDKILKLKERVQSIMNKEFQEYVWIPTAPEYNNPEYILINAFKSFFVCYAIEQKIIASPQAAWIDFGYCRDNLRFEVTTKWRFNAKNKMNLFHILPIDNEPIYKIIKQGDVYFQGGHLIGNLDNWYFFQSEIDKSFSSLIDCDFIDDDQTLILMAYRRNPNSYHIHPVDSKDWFIIFKHFNNLNKPPKVELRKKRVRKSPLWWKECKLWLNRFFK